MTTRSADQYDIIRARLVEIALEARKAEAGDGGKCTAASNDGGPFIDPSKCALHGEPPPVAAAAAMTATQHMPEDDWQTLRAQALRPACIDNPATRLESGAVGGVRRETLRDRLAELGLIAGEKQATRSLAKGSASA